MKETSIANCYISPSSSAEQYIANHTFAYVVAGAMAIFDGSKEYSLQPGYFGIGKRNQLAKYTKHPDNGVFKKIYISFEQDFLKEFSSKYKIAADSKQIAVDMLASHKSALVDNFVQSLLPYFNEKEIIDEAFLQVKRTELLLILLKENPGLAAIFFDFSDPEKINLEEFMNRNYKFNISIERFAYLTGRSLSAFKRDFAKLFNATPSHWLVQKRLEEAHYLLSKKNLKPSDIYLDLGFENFSHFSFAFKKLFGYPPTQIAQASKASGC